MPTKLHCRHSAEYPNTSICQRGKSDIVSREAFAEAPYSHQCRSCARLVTRDDVSPGASVLLSVNIDRDLDGEDEAVTLHFWPREDDAPPLPEIITIERSEAPEQYEAFKALIEKYGRPHITYRSSSRNAA